jgi:uncharacterized protein (DUF1015 family)
VAIDLPHVPPKQLGPEEKYRESAERFEQWKQNGVLVQDQAPALYLYEQNYTWAGRTYCRRAMLAGVRATSLGEDVIPHEHTFAGPKADRLRLTEVTSTQLSPIFGFYNDPIGVTDRLAAAASDEPDLSAEFGGVRENLWIVTDEKVIAEISEALRDIPVYIADGHHRYTTAMNYCDSLRESGEIDEQHPANFVLFALAAKDDPGLVILPYHRMLAGLAADFDIAALSDSVPALEWQLLQSEDADLSDADAFLAPYGETAMALVSGDEIWIARLSDPGAMDSAAADKCEAWRRLDVSILQVLIVDGALEQFKTDDYEATYTPDGNRARDNAAGEGRLSIILQGTPLSAVESIANLGESMPHKSTYFYPKISTGMVLKPLT